MSSRVSGHPGRPRLAVRAALLLTILGLVAGPARATRVCGRSQRPDGHDALPVDRHEAGQHGDLQADDRVRGTAADVALSTRRACPTAGPPASPAAASPFAGAFVAPAKPVEVDLDVDVPDDTTDHRPARSSVVANGPEGAVTLPLTVGVEAAAGGEVTMTSDFPELRGAATTTFTFNLTLRNGTAHGADLRARRAGPRPVLDRQRQARRPVAGGEHRRQARRDRVDHRDRRGARGHRRPGTYPLIVTAAGGGETAQIQLSVVITGSYTVAVSTPNQVLSTTANAGSPTDFVIRVTNSGTAPITAGHARRAPPPPAGR